MKSFNIYRNAAILGLILTLQSCSAVKGIFKAGMWSGIIMVVGVIVLVIWLLSRLFKK